MAKMASPEDLISMQPLFEDEIIEICGSRQKCPINSMFRVTQLGKYFTLNSLSTFPNILVSVDRISTKLSAGIRIVNQSDYAIGFDLRKNGAILITHSSSEDSGYLKSGQEIEYFDTSTATYSINLDMHCSDNRTIDQLCPTCQKKLTINGSIPDDTDFYTVATQLGMVRVISLNVDEGGSGPSPGLQTNDIEVQIRNLSRDPISWHIVSQHPVASTITVQYVVNGSTRTLGTISSGSSTGSSGSMTKSTYNSITSWKCTPSSDNTYRYTVGPNEYQ